VRLRARGGLRIPFVLARMLVADAARRCMRDAAQHWAQELRIPLQRSTQAVIAAVLGSVCGAQMVNGPACKPMDDVQCPTPKLCTCNQGTLLRGGSILVALYPLVRVLRIFGAAKLAQIATSTP
jgi:hypothetical protein